METENYEEINFKHLVENKLFCLECFDEDDETEVKETISKNGNTVISIETERGEYALNSFYDDEQMADVWLDFFKNITQYNVFVLFGLANGIYLEKLQEKYQDNIIIVYEPSPNVTRKWLKRKNQEKILTSDKVYMCTGTSGVRLLHSYFEAFITFGNHNLVCWSVLPGYAQAWREKVIEIYSSYVNVLEDTIFFRNTSVHFEAKIRETLWKNIPDILKQSCMGDLYKEFKNIDLQNEVAIIVSAGPSLDKNILDLKLIKGHAFIIAVDSAMKSLENNGIMPHIAVSVDPAKNWNRFEGLKMIESVPMALEVTSTNDLVRIHGGKRFYANTGEAYFLRLMELIKKDMGTMRTGGSVANNAFSMAVNMGFKRIVLIGQDLGYPNNVSHTKDIFTNQAENKIEAGSKYFEVEDIYGNKILTEYNMNSYRKWFEKQIVNNPDVEVIDATEGGAKINGSVIMTLRDVIKQYCNTKSDVNYAEMIQSVGSAFSEEEQKIISDKLLGLPKLMKSYRKKLKNGILAYEDLDRLKKEKREASKEFKKKYKEIEKLNNFFGSIDENDLFDMYESKSKFELDNKALIIETDEDKEWDETVKIGKAIYERNIAAIDGFLKDAEMYFEDNLYMN